MSRLLAYFLAVLAVALLSAATMPLSTVGSQSGNGEYDRDGDGLIEIQYLEQLDVVRFDLDGDGRPDRDAGKEAYAVAFPTGATEAVCDNDCKGYELARPLDFNDADSYASGVVNLAWTNGAGWQPIQSGEAWIVAEFPFAATFDGNGHTISNLHIDRSADDREDYTSTGLFGSATPDSVIRNVGLMDVRVAGLAAVGGLVGGNLGAVRDSQVTGRVSGVVYVGGLAGFTDFASEISGSHFSGAVAGLETEGQAVGGLVGYQDGVVSASYAVGSVSGHEYVGGLAGENRKHIIASHSSADVTGKAGVGGLVGANRLLISGSYATGSATGDSGVGGLAGYNGAKIIASYATAAATGKEDVGGLAGMNHGYLADITASYATGPVSGHENVGGLVGSNRGEASITASYATGPVSGGDNEGGLIGYNDATVVGAIWDAETSGMTDGVGRGDTAGVTGQTTMELQAANGYAGAYEDWEIDLTYGSYRDYVETPEPHDFWEFGSSGQYPALKAYLGFSGFTDWWESGRQPRAARPPAPGSPPDGIDPPSLARYDRDGDGLIEVSNLEQLDAIRHDLDGDGLPQDGARAEYAAAYPVSGEVVVCRDNCVGYELTRPLDFASDGSYASGEIRKEWTGGQGWRPIGSADEFGGRFNAHFEGNGHAIANLQVNRTSPSEVPPAVGLFGYTGYSAVIGRTGIENASVVGLENTGILAGLNLGTISHVSVTGNVAASGEVVVYTPGEGNRFVGGHAGGMVGVNRGSIVASRSGVNISCADAGNSIGGLAGLNEGAIRDSHATGGVSCGESGDFMGGLTGSSLGTISNSYATGDVVGGSHVGGLTGAVGPGGMVVASYAVGNVTGGRGVGGLAGGSSGVIRGSFATGAATGDNNVGGLAGSNGGAIIASYATGSVAGGGEVGGLVGSNNFGQVGASYATGPVSGKRNVGGLAGESHSSRVVASYATGRVSGGVETGGLIGAESGSIRESVSFWDMQTTGIENSAAGSGKTTAELQSPTAYADIYSDWNADLDDADSDDDPDTGADDFWDFGTRGEYPALKFDLDGDGKATWQEFGNQERTALRPSPTVAGCRVEMMPAGGVVSGAWSGDCLSFNRPGSYARFYAFTLDEDSEVFITLVSEDANTYLYMQEGAGTTGRSFRSQGSPEGYSNIEDWFAAGTYTIEAATYEAAQTGSFTLSVNRPGEPDDCVEIMPTAVITGSWNSDCASGRRPGSYVRLYTFTLAEASEVMIELESGVAGTYLYLLQGGGRTGRVLEDYGSERGSAQLGHTLSAGTYTIEVATYGEGQTGEFTLTVNGLATPPPPLLPPDPPAPALAPMPMPTATHSPSPTFIPTSTSTPPKPTNTPTPTTTPIATGEPVPAGESGGACSYPEGNMSLGTAAVSMFLLTAPLVLIGGLKFRPRRRGGGSIRSQG